MRKIKNRSELPYLMDDSLYVQELKSVAGSFGYSPEDVDTLLREGFSPEELENYFYGEDW